MSARPLAYQHGTILSGAEAEAQKSTQGRRLVRERSLSSGKDSIYNLTGLVRAFPLRPDDFHNLENQFTFYTHYLGQAEDLVLKHTGANSNHYTAIMCNRVSSAILAIMLGTLRKDDRVLSLVNKGRSHPSIQQSVELIGATFHEVQGLEDFILAIKETPWRMLAITPLTPSKYHLPLSDMTFAVKIAKSLGIRVFVDDAHMMARTVFYKEPVTFAIEDIDVSVWSLDKHVPGPRGAAIVGRRELMERISTKAFQFGLEAQSGHYVAMLRGMEAIDLKAISEAGSLALRLFDRLNKKYGERVYQAGPGIAFSAEDYTDLVLERAGNQETPLASSEISVAACFLLLKHYGVVTIPITGYPGAAPTLRLMMHPDGGRFGIERLEEALENVISRTINLLQRPAEVRNLLLGTK